MKKFLIIFFLILFASVGIAGYWYWQKNQYSKEILKLEILTPDTLQSGDEVTYLVRFKNNGNLRLESPELIFQYPEHCIPQEGFSQRITKKIDDIYPGEEKIVKFKGRVFGEKGETLEAKAWLSYRPKNLQARYESKTSQVIQIKFVPLTFEFDLPLKAENGEEIKFSLNYFSNINYLLKNLRVRIEYPEGFHFLNSSPGALDETEWTLPALNQADGGRIEISGRINGKEDESKVFRAQLGLVKDDEFIILKDTSQSLKIVTPTLYISQLINGHQNYVANSGDLLHYEVFFKNIGSKIIQKKFLLAKLDGNLFDLSTLKSEKGEVAEGDNSIIWDWKSVPALRFLDVGEESKVEFWVKIKDNLNQKIKNPVLRDKISLGGVRKIFETKVNSRIVLSQKVYSQQEFWENSGPLPPKVGEPTQYTVVWQVRNFWNDLEKVRIRGVLPKNVKPTGKIFPEDAKFTFDPESHEVIWNIGDIKAWLGGSEVPLTLAFQIEFQPDSSQKGKTPNLVGEAEVLGEDTWTSEIIQEKAGPVNTTLPDDKTVTEEQGVVQ